MILVAIAAGGTRVRDYTPTHSCTDWQGNDTTLFDDSGGFSAFLNFLQDELIPAIETRYCTAAHRTLIGHSLGGLALTQCMLMQPTLFQAYLSSDASLWWQQQHCVEQLEQLPPASEKTPAPGGRYYSALADHEMAGLHDMSSLVQGNQRFVQILQQRYSSTLAVEQHTFADETHGSLVVPALYAGLRYLFYQHRLPHGWAPDLNTLVKHYQTFSTRLGFDYPPPERRVDQLAWESASPVLAADTAQAFLLHNCQQYPLSSHAHSSLGRWFLSRHDHAQARQYFERALILYSDNIEAKNGLTELRENLRHTKTATKEKGTSP